MVLNLSRTVDPLIWNDHLIYGRSLKNLVVSYIDKNASLDGEHCSLPGTGNPL